MALLVLRHAHARSRGSWDAPDAHRPLDAKGQAQAVALVDSLADRRLGRLVTSPLTRCVQSLEALAAARQLPLEQDEALAEGTPGALVLDRWSPLADRPRDVVLCTHGDVIEGLLVELAARGAPLGGGPTAQKASVWVLEGRGAQVAATYRPPPEVTSIRG